MLDSTKEFPLEMVISYLLNGPYGEPSENRTIGARWQELEHFACRGVDLKAEKIGGLDPCARLTRLTIIKQYPQLEALGTTFPWIELQERAKAEKWNKDDPHDPEVFSRHYRDVTAKALGKEIAPRTLFLKPYAAMKALEATAEPLARAMQATQRRTRNHGIGVP